MRLAVATTTIHDCSRQLKWLHACDLDVPVFVAGDERSVPFALTANTEYYDAHRQRMLNYKCSGLLGFSTIERRNIAVLEAVKHGADAVIFLDTDNLPLGSNYYWNFESVLNVPFSGLSIRGRNGWFDPGRLLNPPTTQRGFPHQVESAWSIDPKVYAKVGVTSGTVLGDSDIPAFERIANGHTTHGMSELLRQGVLVDLDTWTIFNTQNTCVLRNFVPAMLTCPQFGRYSDIFASLVCQRAMREHGYHVHVGPPFVWQQRHEHDLVKDLQDEIFGMAHVVEFAKFLDEVDLSFSKSVIEQVLGIYQLTEVVEWLPDDIVSLAEAWLSDCEAVL